MLNLKSLIQSLSNEEYNAFKDQLLERRAEKYLSLYNHYYLDEARDEEIMNELEINNNAFYVMKSRLHVKLQGYLTSEILKRDDFNSMAETLTYLTFEENKDKAIAILTKLEKDYQTNNSYKELVGVYDALKKLHLNTSKEEEYFNAMQDTLENLVKTEKYDHAYNQVISKIGQLLTSDNNEFVHGIDKNLDLLAANEDTDVEVEIKSLIAQLMVKLFVPAATMNAKTDASQDLLNELKSVLFKNKNRIDYEYYSPIFHFLNFHYNSLIGSTKGAKNSFDVWNANLNLIVRNYHSTFAFLALKSKVNYYYENEKENYFKLENNVVKSCFNPDIEDTVGVIALQRYLAETSFVLEEYSQASRALINLVNWISFKRHPKSEIETKLLLTISYIMSGKYEQSWNILRSVSRKTRDLNTNGQYEAALKLCKVLRTFVNSNHKDIEEKIESLINQYERANDSNEKLLPFVDLRKCLINKETIRRAA